MTAPRPIVAVVPFGSTETAPGAWARQIARRLVDRLSDEPGLELRPVFLVAVPDDDREAGYVVLGSTPDAAQAASYASSIGAGFALTGTLADDGGRALELALVRADGTEIAREGIALPSGALATIEGRVARWLAARLLIDLRGDVDAPAAVGDDAYARLLEGLDEEVNEAVLLRGSPEAAAEAGERARRLFLEAVREDPRCEPAIERILVRAAESLERDDVAANVESLERLVEIEPRSWRAQYLLGELRRAGGDASGAVVAFEHANALRPPGPDDLVRLAELYLVTGAPGSAAAHLRRALRSGEAGEANGRARRLLLGLEHPDLERELEEAGRIAIGGDDRALDGAAEMLERVVGADPRIWEAHFGVGLLARRRGDAAAAERAFRRVLELVPDQPEALQLAELAHREAQGHAPE